MKASPVSWQEFREKLADHQPHDFGITLNGGIISRKTVTLLKNGRYKIHNHIDETEQVLTPQEIQEHKLTNIGKAIDNNALVSLNDSS